MPNASGPLLLSTTPEHLKLDAISYSNVPNLANLMDLNTSAP